MSPNKLTVLKPTSFFRKCPACDRDVQSQNEIFPDQAVRKKILSLEMKCPVKRCKWKGTLQDFIEASFYSSCDDDAVTITIKPLSTKLYASAKDGGGG